MSMEHAYQPASLEIQAMNEKEKPRSELRKRLQERSTLPEEFLDKWMERGVAWSEDGNAGRFARDFRMTSPMILPWYTSSFLNPDILLNNLTVPVLKICGTESNLGVDWSPKNSMVFDESVVEWVEKFDKLENVKLCYLPGNHHFFVTAAESAKTAELIHDFIDNK